MERQNKINVLALLKLIAQNNGWQELTRNQKFWEFLQKKGVSGEDLLKIKDNPSDISVLKSIFSAILEKGLEFPEPEASRWGLQICNILKKTNDPLYNDCNQVSRFNVQKNQFEWSK